MQHFFFCIHFITTFHRLSFSFSFSYPESYSFRNFLSLISRNTLLSTLNRIIRYYKWFFFCSLWFICINLFSGFFSFLKPKKKIRSNFNCFNNSQYSTSFLVNANRKMRPRFRAWILHCLANIEHTSSIQQTIKKEQSPFNVPVKRLMLIFTEMSEE